MTKMDEFKPEVPESEKPYTKYDGEVLYSGAPTKPESTDPSSIDKGHGDRGSLNASQESTAKSPEAKHSIFDVLRKKKVSIPIIGTVAAAAVLAAGISRLNSNDSSHQGNQPVAAASVTPGSTETPTATPTETASAELNPEKYTANMEQYTEMDAATFEALPREERLSYAQYLIDYTVSHEVYNAMYSTEYGDNGASRITPTTVSLNNTGEEILKDRQYTQQITYLQLVDGASSPTLDQTKSREVLSAMYYDVGNNKEVTGEYMQDIKVIEESSKPGAFSSNEVVADTSDILTGKDSQTGDVVQYKIVSYIRNVDGVDYSGYARFVYYGFISYDGSQKSVWLLDAQSIKSLDELKTLGSINQSGY